MANRKIYFFNSLEDIKDRDKVGFFQMIYLHNDLEIGDEFDYDEDYFKQLGKDHQNQFRSMSPNYLGKYKVCDISRSKNGENVVLWTYKIS